MDRSNQYSTEVKNKRMMLADDILVEMILRQEYWLTE
jgi:hypothetical protein